MVKTITNEIALISGLAWVLANQLTLAECPPLPSACQIEAHVIDEDPNGLNVRLNPGVQSKILGTLPKNTEVKVLAYQNIHRDDLENSWVLVSPISSDQQQFNGNGWVSVSLLGLYTKGYDSQSVPLYSKPSQEKKASNVIERVRSDSLVTLLGCEGTWSLVKAKNLKDELVKGWLESEQQCRSPYTTCS